MTKLQWTARPISAVRSVGAAAIVLALVAGSVTLSAQSADAAVVRPFTLNYSEGVYGDFILAGNGSMACPAAGSPVDPFGEPLANCTAAQAGTNTAATGINDSYYMKWSDADSIAATYNSSAAQVTIPAGARVSFARLNWSGNTGTIRLADGTVAALPGCNTRQFLAGAGTADLPSGTPESTLVRLSVGGAATAAYAPQVISRDALANVPASQPQFYSAYADVTSRFAGVTTGSPVAITVSNVWTPQGFGCYGGWSLTVVYAYDEPHTNAPIKKRVMVYDGHVRQSSIDPMTTITASGFTAAAAGARVGVTAFEGDFNIAGDRFLVSGENQAGPAPGSATNFFVSRGEYSSVLNNMSVDAKSMTAPIAVGATSASMAFATSGDTYLATGLALSVPIASVDVSIQAVSSGPYVAGDTITYEVRVHSPLAASDVAVSSNVPGCEMTPRPLLAGSTHAYGCSRLAVAGDGTTTVTASSAEAGANTFTASLTTTVSQPAVEITKTADKATYVTGEEIVFTIAVNNSGDVPLTDVTVTDATVPACARTVGALAVGSATVSYTCTAIAPIAADSNTAAVTAAFAASRTVTDSSTVSVPTVGSVGGTVFADRNNNGLVDSAEYGISGVSVALTGTTASGSAVSYTTTTGSAGAYVFEGMPAGTYTVTQTQPAAYDDGIDTAGTNAVVASNDSVAVTLTSGQSSSGTLFGERPTSSLSGAVYIDSDADGVQDAGEQPLGAVTIELSGRDSDNNEVELTAVTDASTGAYRFDGLRPGTYELVRTSAPGYGNGNATVGTSGGTRASATTITTVTIAARTAASGYLFGVTTGSLSGDVFVDLDGDGIRSIGESGLGGVNVTLTGTTLNGSITPLMATTSGDGSFAFSGLLAGTYTVTETQPAGYLEGTNTIGTAGGTIVSHAFSAIVLGAGESGTGYLFAKARLIPPVIPPVVTPPAATPTPVAPPTGGQAAAAKPTAEVIASAPLQDDEDADTADSEVVPPIGEPESDSDADSGSGPTSPATGAPNGDSASDSPIGPILLTVGIVSLVLMVGVGGVLLFRPRLFRG